MSTTFSRAFFADFPKKIALWALYNWVHFEGRQWAQSDQQLPIGSKRLIQDSVARHYANLARLENVTRDKVSQIMDLSLLVPAIQEAILFLPAVDGGGDPINERHLRDVVAVLDWRSSGLFGAGPSIRTGDPRRRGP